jgi:hypothetical protein
MYLQEKKVANAVIPEAIPMGSIMLVHRTRRFWHQFPIIFNINCFMQGLVHDDDQLTEFVLDHCLFFNSK